MTVAAMVRRLIELGASAEIIAVAVSEVEAEQGRLEASEEAKKAYERDRKARWRMSRDSPGTMNTMSRDKDGTMNTMSRDSPGTVPGQDEKRGSPTPPKKTTSSEQPKRTRDETADKPGKKGSRCPEDWQPSDGDREYALNAGWTPREVDVSAEDFVDYWTNLPGKAGLKLNWSKAWRVRVRKFGPTGTQRSNQRQRSPEKSGVTDVLRDIEERIRERDNPTAASSRGAGPGPWPIDRSTDGRNRDDRAGPVLDLEPIRPDRE